MRNLLIAYTCNSSEGIRFGNLIKPFDEFPCLHDIELEIRQVYPDSNNICILNIQEFNDEDFKRLIK